MLDGSVSELELSDDEADDPDVDPDYRPGSDPEEVSEEENELDHQQPDSSVGSSCSTAASERVFWKRTTDFFPLPPAPEHVSPSVIPLNLPPEDYVSKYLPDDLFSILSEYTNRRYHKGKGKALKCTPQEMKIFFAAAITMSYLGYPRIRMYWSEKTRVKCIADNITRERYKTIRNNLKLLDDDEVSDAEKLSNKFWKVKPIFQLVLNGCLLNPRDSKVCVDKQMIPF